MVFSYIYNCYWWNKQNYLYYKEVEEGFWLVSFWKKGLVDGMAWASLFLEMVG
jgi:hypothetical protein